MNTKFVKIIGLLGAFCAGGLSIASGDVAMGAGIISAALSSAGIFAKQ